MPTRKNRPVVNRLKPAARETGKYLEDRAWFKMRSGRRGRAGELTEQPRKTIYGINRRADSAIN
jgi:hypothetical protein